MATPTSAGYSARACLTTYTSCDRPCSTATIHLHHTDQVYMGMAVDVDGEHFIFLGPVLNLAVLFDRHTMNGLNAVGFLTELKSLMQKPLLVLIASQTEDIGETLYL